MVAPNGQSTLAESSMDEAAIEGLPALTPAGNRFVSAYIHSGFDLAAAATAAQIPLSRANHFTTNAAILAHVEAHSRFLHSTHKCKATVARNILIDELIKHLPEVADPREKRLLLQQLHRATSAPIAPFPRPTGNGTPRWNESNENPDAACRSEIPDRRSELDTPQSEIQNPQSKIEDALPTHHSPIILNTDAPSQIAPKIMAVLKTPDQPWPDADLTIIADAVEFDAEVNGDLVGSDEDMEIVEALAETSLPSLRSHRAAHHLESINHSDHNATELWSVETAAGHVKVTIDFARSLETDADSLSRFPGRWMIKQITTGPAHSQEKSPSEDG